MRDTFASRRLQPRGFARYRGFSLVEMLMVTVLVTSSALAAAPLLSEWHARDRVDGAARALLAGLTLARGEAIARGMRVVVCPADDGARCLTKTQSCAARRSGWSCGWAVVAGPRFGGRALRIYRRPPGVSIAATSAAAEFTPPAGQVIGGFRAFELEATGIASGGSDDALRRCIRVAAGGRARLERGGCDGRVKA